MKSKATIISIVGARPQFVKLAPLVQPLATAFHHRIVHSGQHYDDNMSLAFFRQFRIPPASLNLGVRGGSQGSMIGRMLTRLEEHLEAQRPDLVLVYGDANTTLAGALAAAKLSLPVGHIEAGMRATGVNMPEEVNRRLTDQVSDILFCVTETALENVRAEGIRKRTILTGDLMLEALHQSRRAVTENKRLLSRLGLRKNRYLLVTAHRPATTDSETSLGQLLNLLSELNEPVLFPLHPRTRRQLSSFRLLRKLKAIPGLVLADPFGYIDTLTAARFAKVVLTDSGGLQKEALALGTPVLTLRNETEWVETLGRGNDLVGLDSKRARVAIRKARRVKRLGYRVGGKRPSQIVLAEIKSFLGERR